MGLRLAGISESAPLPTSLDPVFIWRHESVAQATGELRRRGGA